jgi:hypothetical protein
MRWVIEGETNKKIQSYLTQDLVKLVTQDQVKSSHHNFMLEHCYCMSASVPGKHLSLNVFNSEFELFLCIASVWLRMNKHFLD